MKRQIKIFAMLAILFVAMVWMFGAKEYSSESSTDFMWLGGTGYWSDSSKWEGGNIPDDPNDWAYFPDGNYTVFIDTNVNIAAIVAGQQNVFMSSSQVYVEKLFHCEYIQNTGALFTKHIVDSLVLVHSGILGLCNINSSTLNVLPGVAVRNITNYAGDLTGDNRVDLEDFAILSQDWLK